MARSSSTSYIRRIGRAVRAYQAYLLTQGRSSDAVSPEQRRALHYFLDTRAPDEDGGSAARHHQDGGGTSRSRSRGRSSGGGSHTTSSSASEPRRDVLAQLGV